MVTTSMDSTTYLNRYRLIPDSNGTPVVLERGPGGVTYQAEDAESGRTVAVKLVPTYSFEPTELEQLEAEARAAQLVDHPNIARLYDFGVSGGDVIFVTEVLDGITLDAWVNEHGALPAAASLRVALQVVAGLAAAAFHSVVYRSIQPATLMIVPGQTPDGEWPLVKVLNFGGLPASFSAADFSFGRGGSSAHFASPEQLKGYPVDFRSELYSLGCTIWFLLTGAPPVPGNPDKGNRIPKALRPILAQMVALDPMQRPQDLVLLQEQLRDCLALIDRRETTARKFGVPVGAAASVAPSGDVLRNTKLLLKPLAYAAGVLLLIGVIAFAAPHLLRFRANTAAEPIGVPVGVPDASAAPASPDGVASNTAPTPVPIAERTPGETDVAEAQARSSGAAAATTVAPDAASPEPESRQALVSIPESTPPPPTAEDASAESAPAVADTKSEPPAVAANSTASDRDNNGTTPAFTRSETADRPEREPVAESTPGTDPVKSAAQRKEVAASSEAAPSPAKPTGTTKAPSRRTGNRRDEVLPAEPVDPSDLANAPPVPRGSKRARYIGTTPEGDLVFGLPSNERGYVAPNNSRRRRVRRALPVPEPAIVLPAEPVDPDDE